jgi:hypothetical protein
MRVPNEGTHAMPHKYYLLKRSRERAFARRSSARAGKKHKLVMHLNLCRDLDDRDAIWMA